MAPPSLPPIPGPTRPGLLVRVLDGVWIHPNTAHTTFASQFDHPLGTFGYPFHIALATFAAFSIAGPVVLVELGAIPLLVCWLARLPFVWRGIGVVLRQPANLCVVAWAVWLLISISWSSDPSSGWHEATFTRWLWLALAIWPVLDRRRWLIAALCIGFALAHLAQFAEWIALRQGVTLFWHPPAPPDPLARVSGWWQQPAAGGVMCAASLGLHIGPALMGTGWRRWTGLVGSATAVTGLLMTGARGSMLAAAALFIVAGVLAITRAARTNASSPGSSTASRAAGWRRAAVVMVVVALVSAIAWTAIGGRVVNRVSLARAEITRVAAGDADSDIGARIIGIRAAVDAFSRAPLQGHGAGSFLPLVQTYATDRAINIADFRLKKIKTAHNTPLHALATTGLIGGGLLFATWACVLWGAGRGRIGASAWLEEPGSYSAAPLFALLALCFSSAFETTYLNMTMQALFCLLLALSPVVRPRPIPGAGAFSPRV